MYSPDISLVGIEDDDDDDEVVTGDDTGGSAVHDGSIEFVRRLNNMVELEVVVFVTAAAADDDGIVSFSAV